MTTSLIAQALGGFSAVTAMVLALTLTNRRIDRLEKQLSTDESEYLTKDKHIDLCTGVQQGLHLMLLNVLKEYHKESVQPQLDELKTLVRNGNGRR
jgi:hypothetical protein